MAATQQQQRDGIGALTSRLAISHAVLDRGSINAARINGAETRADAQMDDVIAKIGGRIVADARQHMDSCASGEAGRTGSASPTLCVDCGQARGGAIGRTGTRIPHLCQRCLNDADSRLMASRARTDAMLSRLGASMQKPKPPVMVEGQKLVCTCGGTAFSRVRPMADEPEVNLKGHRGGFDCDDCGKFFEHPEADFVDEYDRFADEQATRKK